MSDLIRKLQNTDHCYCGSQVIDGELQLVACLFHQAADALEQKDKRIKELTVRSVKYSRGIDRRNKLIGKKNEEIRYLRKWKWDAERPMKLLRPKDLVRPPVWPYKGFY